MAGAGSCGRLSKSDPDSICSFGIDVRWGPCELIQQCKRPDAYLVGEQDVALDNSVESSIGHTPNYPYFQRRPKRLQLLQAPFLLAKEKKGR
jgi:hypothetical protein